ncbi:prealbumin-like fold domain-containing protein [Periweissella cryptocerci]|nr:prealbumin-like fold domain-containing protein [Periweissella cryptocerci]
MTNKRPHHHVRLWGLCLVLLSILSVAGLLKFSAFIHADESNTYQLRVHSELAGQVALVPLDKLDEAAEKRLLEPQAATNYYQAHQDIAQMVTVGPDNTGITTLAKGNYLLVPVSTMAKDRMLLPMIIDYDNIVKEQQLDAENQVDLYMKQSVVGSMQVTNLVIGTSTVLIGSQFRLVHYDPTKVDITKWTANELRESPSQLGVEYFDLTTDENGRIKVDTLPFGFYYLVQLSVDGKYDLRDTPMFFEISASAPTWGFDPAEKFYNYPHPQLTKTADRESFEFSYSRPFDKVPAQYRMPWTVTAELHAKIDEFQNLKLVDNLGKHWNLAPDSLKVIGKTATGQKITLQAGVDYQMTTTVNGKNEHELALELVKNGVATSQKIADVVSLQLDYTTITDNLPTDSNRVWYHDAKVFDNHIDMYYSNLADPLHTLSADAHVWVGGYHIQVVTTKKNLAKSDVIANPKHKQNPITLKGTEQYGLSQTKPVKYYPLDGAKYRVYRERARTKEYLHYNDQGTLESRTTLQWRTQPIEATVLTAGDGWLTVNEAANDKTGKFVLTGMQKGQYYLEEITPPKGGYRPLKQIVPFEIHEATWPASFDAPIVIRYDLSKAASVYYPETGGEDVKHPKKVSKPGKKNIIQERLDNFFPKTGGIAIQLIAFVGGIILIILAFLLGKRQRKDKATD